GVINAYGAGSNDHVYAFTPEVTGVYTVTVTAEFDSLTYVAGDCYDIGSTCLGAQDSIGAGVEEVVFNATGGETTFIFVDGWSNVSNAFGTYTIDVSAPCFPDCTGKVCGPDECGSTCGVCDPGKSCVPEGTECVDNSLIPGSTCINPFDVTEAPAVLEGDTSGASNDLNVPEEGGCTGTSSTLGKASFDQVWRFTPPEAGGYTITLDAEFDSALYIFTDCEDIANTCLGAKDTTGAEELIVSGDPSTPLYIVVDGWSSYTNLMGPYTLTISEPCIASCEGKICGSDGCGGTCGVCAEGEGCDPFGACLPFDQLPGNTCATPVAMDDAPMEITGETTAASNDFSFSSGACPDFNGSRGGASNDRVHMFTAPAGGVYTFGLDATFDTAIYVAGDCADIDGTCMGAEDKVNQTEYVIVSLDAGEVVYVVVDGWSDYSNSSGEYTLSVSEPCTPDCAGKACGADGCGDDCGTCPPGESCDNGTGQCVDSSGQCVPNANKQCVEIDGVTAVYWYDSCGEQGAHEETCQAGEYCASETGECVEACIPHAAKRCDGDTIVWHDSCGDAEGPFKACDPDQYCVHQGDSEADCIK
ncbi:MAG: hypothetical protein QF464_14295, partial [Myxococcota bacterium]|nr:hypothetical protein [Myxococcota bacterium]